MALISVIIPVYKVEQYLRRCIDSVLAQTFSSFELILVDDGSPDRCGIICDEYAKIDDRIRVLHQNNSGLSAARNTGIDWVFANSNSKYITFIDSDDWVHSRYLELLLKALEKYDADISQCMMNRTSELIKDCDVSGKTLCVTPEEQYENWYSAFAWGKLYQKSIFKSLRYPVGLLYEDVTIWYKLLFALNRIAIVDEELYYYYQRDEGITNSTWVPAKLSQVYAWDEQLEFARSYGSEPVLRTAVKRGCGVYRQHYIDIDASDRITNKEKTIYKRKVMKKLRAVIRNNKKELNDVGLYRYYFEFAYPRLNWLKWTAIGIMGKFRRKKK